MNFKKVIAILLIISCLALPLVSCKKNEKTKTDDSEGENNTTEKDDNKPGIEIDIGGQTGGNTSNPDDNIGDDVGSGSGNNAENGDDGDKDGKEDSDPAPSIPEALTFEEFEALSSDDQEAYFYSYANPVDFFTWYNEAKAKYDEEHKAPELGGDGEIDIGDLIGGN